jgi:nitrite reductase (NO-forming)
VTTRRTDTWIARWLESPEKMLASDDQAKALRKRFAIDMPNQGLSAEDIRQLIRYFHSTEGGHAASTRMAH